MSVEQKNVIDFAGIDNDSGKLILSISDHLPWNGNEDDHIKKIQEKIYAYLDYVYSEEFKGRYPNIEKKDIIINVGYKHVLNSRAEEFYQFINKIVEDEGVELRYSLFSPEE